PTTATWKWPEKCSTIALLDNLRQDTMAAARLACRCYCACVNFTAMKNRIAALLFIAVLVCSSMIAPTRRAMAQQKDLGVFDGQSDIGQVLKPGHATYDAVKQQYTLTGSGTNMWLDNDEFHMIWKRMKGDFILTCRA